MFLWFDWEYSKIFLLLKNSDVECFFSLLLNSGVKLQLVTELGFFVYVCVFYGMSSDGVNEPQS